MKRVIASSIEDENSNNWIKPSFDELDNYGNCTFITDQPRGVRGDQFKKYNLLGKFIGYDGTEYVALVGANMFKDKSYLNFKSFNKNYHLFEGE
jgi:hypothetical protein